MFKKDKISQNIKNETPLLNAKTKKVIAALLASLTGVSATMVASAIIAYDATFPRWERPNYALYPGDYCYERVKDRLPREEFYYQTATSELKGYYYPSAHGKGLVVIAHGFHAGADDYLPMAEFFVTNGYNVFSYDCTGVYDSKGDGMVGMCQSLIDLDETLSYLKRTEPYKKQPMFLVGHSWGGYAVGSVLELQKGIKAAACIAPMNSGYNIMQEKGEQYVGKVAVVSKPVFHAYQKYLFKDYIKYSGAQGISSVTIPVLIAQGIDDTIITYDKQSIMAHRSEITNPNVIYYEGYGVHGDHNNIWHSKESALYQAEVESGLKKLKLEKGAKLTDEEKAEFYKTVNHSLYSEVNPILFGQILDMFNKGI